MKRQLQNNAFLTISLLAANLLSGQVSNIDFTTQVYPAFQEAGCLGCHGSSGGFTIGDDAATAYDNIVNGTPGNCGLTYVVPGDPSSSFLYEKITQTPSCGNRMPNGNPGYFDVNADELEIISVWITKGARKRLPITIHVPTDSLSIQAAIDGAIDGDTVLVQPGTYIENINFNGKNIMVGSLTLITGDTSYISQTVIDGDSSGSVVTFINGEDSSAVLNGLTIINGSGRTQKRRPAPPRKGGGIYCESSNPSLVNVTVGRNSAALGGGIYCINGADLSITNVTIKENHAELGGGMYIQNSRPIFDLNNRCNIYYNEAEHGSDLYVGYDTVSVPIYVVVDSFTVMKPTDYYALPQASFSFDIQNAKLEQVEADLYISPDGDNANSGFSPTDPLRTIGHILPIVQADSLHARTIFLAEGTYSPSVTGEQFPLILHSHISLVGASENSVVLDAEEQGGVLSLYYSLGANIENLTITGGMDYGISCDFSSPHLESITVSGNSGSGIYCENSSPRLVNITICGNGDVGFTCSYGSPILENVLICGNTGGIASSYSNPSLMNVKVSGNAGDGIHFHGVSSFRIMNTTVSENAGTGIYSRKSSLLLQNVTVTRNAEYGIWAGSSSATVVNTILWNNSPAEFYTYSCLLQSIAIAYSDIQGGEDGFFHSDTGRVNWSDGNIDADPMFADTANGDYTLSLGSPCIDVGNPNTLYNDPEDPANPGYALWPAMGTLRNDMGAFGGNSDATWLLAIDEEYGVKRPLPEGFALHQNYPNPFNPVSTIRYELPQASEVSLIVYDILGREVARLADGYMEPGFHEVQWDGRDYASGIYIARLVTPEYSQSIKMVLLK
jgi:hypothetical protein